MKVADHLRRAVVFLGFRENLEKEDIKCVGTAFLVVHDGHGYLVTAKHVAIGIGDSPYSIRVNKEDGSSDIISVDPVIDKVTWKFHDDIDIDVAVMPFNYDLKAKSYDVLYTPSNIFVDHRKLDDANVGIGDFCYTVGLFSLLSGKGRNLPVVHSGTVALTPGQEKIPCEDWDEPGARKVKYVDAYLVETQSLAGLSGAPVFVRPTIDLCDLPTPEGPLDARLAQSRLFLLGLWRGAWDASPDAVLAVHKGEMVKVPVGMGVVIPASMILDILEADDMKEKRAEIQEL